MILLTGFYRIPAKSREPINYKTGQRSAQQNFLPPENKELPPLPVKYFRNTVPHKSPLQAAQTNLSSFCHSQSVKPA